METYTLRENHVILNPRTDEEDISEYCNECEYCSYDVETCRGNKTGCMCDWFTIIPGYKEVD